MKLNINDDRSVKLFNNTYSRACWHRKRRVRKKNYRRARRLLGFPLYWPKKRKIYLMEKKLNKIGF